MACVKDDPNASAAESSAPPPSVKPAQASPANLAAQRIEIAPSLERSCRQICDRSLQLQCASADKCLPNCLAMGSATPCSDEMLGFYQCLIAQPVQNWECAPDGVAAIRRGLCGAEQERTVACMESKMH
jgi:hypothetical protein